MLEDLAQSNVTYVAVEGELSSLNAKEMKLVCQQIRFYSTLEKRLKLLQDAKFKTQTIRNKSVCN